jgi:hypothetical protein
MKTINNLTLSEKKIYTRSKGFSEYTLNKHKYNKAACVMTESLYNIMVKDAYVNKIISNYVEEIILTSMDRTPDGTSHGTPDKAVDFYVYPSYLTPFIFLYLAWYRHDNNSSVLLSLHNHHIHFNTPSTRMFGYEIAVDSSKQPVLPVRYDQNFDKYNYVLNENLPLFSNTALLYYMVDILIPDFYSKYIDNISTLPELTDNDKKAVVSTMCYGLGTNYNDFVSYLRMIGKHTNGWDVIKMFSPREFATWIEKKSSEIAKSDFGIFIKIIAGGVIAYSLTPIIKKIFK